MMGPGTAQLPGLEALPDQPARANLQFRRALAYKKYSQLLRELKAN
jgi:hypothetical protein